MVEKFLDVKASHSQQNIQPLTCSWDHDIYMADSFEIWLMVNRMMLIVGNLAKVTSLNVTKFVLYTENGGCLEPIANGW